MQAALFGVGRAQVGIKVVREADGEGGQRGDLSGGQEVVGGSGCSGAADGRLNEAAAQWRDAREERLRVRLIAHVEPLRCVQDLANAGNAAVGEQAEAGADHAFA